MLTVVLAAGCTGPPAPEVPPADPGRTPAEQLAPLADPRQKSGPSTATVATPDVVPISRDVRPELPTTVTDAQGTEVTVTSVDRILAFDVHGTLGATVFGLGLGGRMAGRDTSTGFPAAAHLPLITTNGHRLDADVIEGLRPTVVITDTTIGPWDVVLRLRSSGVPVVVTDSRRAANNVGPLTQQVADALGVPDEGRALARRTTVEIEKAKIAAHRLAGDAALRIVFLYVRGRAGVAQVLGAGTGADELITAVGAVDGAGEAGIEGATPIDPEALARAAPDVVLVMSAGLRSVGGVEGVTRLPGVAGTPAGQKRRVVDMSDHQVLGFGPLTASVIDGLARALYT
ncbi:iron complex transport system substrate-binding protein [Lentzea xinjiangensis]|uniref:Iron complex transport system substrate-binding protein n=1 Tax=Lentzea xinjiangensis TaxID=402600 RepID=A0A1H9RQP9_9PSEU|nr:iron complex transport system substrate-binding protein [Lentzea xinjiangensis]